MAQPFCTGAVHVYVAPGSVTSPAGATYLGSTESFPGMDTSRSWDAVMNDISGSKDPFDYIYEGPGVGVVSLVLTRWNQDPLTMVKSLPGPGGSSPGFATLADIGSLAGFEGFAFKLWLLYTFGSTAFGAKAAYAAMEPGRFYPQCILWGPERTEGGTRAKKEHLIILAWKKFNPQNGTFTLYSEAAPDLTGLPAIN
jgi:hypothetical protein